MARKHIEFITEYLCPGPHGWDYEYYDTHGILTRCKNCKHWGELSGLLGTVPACLLTETAMGEDDYCSRAEPVGRGDGE